MKYKVIGSNEADDGVDGEAIAEDGAFVRALGNVVK